MPDRLTMVELMKANPTPAQQEYNYALQFWDLVKKHEEANLLLEANKDSGAPVVTEEE